MIYRAETVGNRVKLELNLLERGFARKDTERLVLIDVPELDKSAEDRTL